MSGICEVVGQLRSGSKLILILERSVLRLVLPRTMSDRRNVAISGDLLAQLEDGHADRHDEAEERQLQRVPGFQAEHADRQRYQRHRFQQDEHEDGNDDFLQLGFTGLIDGTALAELYVEGELIVLDVARAHLHGGVERQLEGHVVRGQVGLHGVDEGTLATGGNLLCRVRIARYLHRIGYLEESKGHSELSLHLINECSTAKPIYIILTSLVSKQETISIKRKTVFKVGKL